MSVNVFFFLNRARRFEKKNHPLHQFKETWWIFKEPIIRRYGIAKNTIVIFRASQFNIRLIIALMK
jgi:hypothetical protein